MNKQSRLAPAADRSGSPALRSAVTSKPWGNQPICPTCNRGATYNCVCGEWIADEEMMPAADVVRIMRDFFPETGWGLAERSALGMVKP